MVEKLGGKSINMFSDSRLVVGQVNGELEARDERMQEYLVQAKHLQVHFDLFSLRHVSNVDGAKNGLPLSYSPCVIGTSEY